jgi:hypothetical protein
MFSFFDDEIYHLLRIHSQKRRMRRRMRKKEQVVGTDESSDLNQKTLQLHQQHQKVFQAN